MPIVFNEPLILGKKEVFNPEVFTVIGEPTITDEGIVSGFSDGNYISFSFDSVTPTQSVEISLRIIINSAPSATQRIISSTTDAYTYIGLYPTSINDKIQSDNISLGVSASAGQFINGEYIDIYTRYTKTEHYFKTVTQRGYKQERSQNINIDNFNALTSFNIGRGGTYNGNYLANASIDLKELEIKIDDENVFKGTKLITPEWETKPFKFNTQLAL